jgi:hypothetical protein
LTEQPAAGRPHGPSLLYQISPTTAKTDSFTVRVQIGERTFEVRYLLQIVESYDDNRSTNCAGKPTYTKRISSVDTYINQSLATVSTYEY